jgi:hypothetical protein
MNNKAFAIHTHFVQRRGSFEILEWLRAALPCLVMLVDTSYLTHTVAYLPNEHTVIPPGLHTTAPSFC